MTAKQAGLIAMIALGILLIGAGLAKAASDEVYRPVPRWQIWVAEPGQPWRMRGKAVAARTACDLDLASLANVLPPGTRIECRRLQDR